MAKLKKPLNSNAVKTANDEFYAKHPEMVVDGKRIQLDPNNSDHQALMREWTNLYVANGGELETDTSSTSTIKTQLQPTEPYVKFKDGVRSGTPIQVSTDAHVFIATSECIYVIDAWPLREYYVYMDIDPSDKVDFDTMGLLWTDENGFPHYTDGQGHPTERVPAFVLAWSKKSSTEIQQKGASVAMIYDRDRDKLNEKKKKVEQQAGGGPLPDKFRLDMISRLTEVTYGRGISACLHVPRDKDTLDVDKLKELMTECDEAIAAAGKTNQAIYDYISENLLNKTLYFNREQINDWLAADPDLKYHLLKDGFGRPLYQVACDTFDKNMEKLSRAHLVSLDKLEKILSDDKKAEQLGQIDLIIENLYDPDGEHLLWRHQFLCEALGFFAGTNRQHEIYEKFIDPLVTDLSEPFGPFRNKCGCKTCDFFQDQVTTVPNPQPKFKTGYKMWKAKDLKLGTRTAMRTLDLFTKFKDNIAFLKAKNGLLHFGTSEEYKNIFLFSWNYFIRSGILKPSKESRPLPENVKKWLEFLTKKFEDAKKAEGSIEEMVKEAKKLITNDVKAKVSNFSKVGDCLSLLGAASVYWYIFTKEGKFGLKDAMDFGNALCDTAKATIGLGKKSAEKAIISKFGEEAGKKWVKSIGKWTPRIAVAGGVFQVAGAYISLSDAADKGDAREFGWAAVTYTGASISLAGLTLDVMPEPIVTKGAGVSLNFIGGLIYLFGSAGEFFTRPDDVERFLRNEGFWREESYETPYKPEKLTWIERHR